MRILLVSLNRLSVPYPVYPLGVDHVAGAIAPQHEARVLDLIEVARGEEPKALAAAVAQHQPQAIGISIRNVDTTDATEKKGFFADMRAVVEAARAASGAPVILGGAGYTLFPDELLEATGADYGVVGEGERLVPLLDALAQKTSPEGLVGVAVRGKPSQLPPPWRGEFTRALPTHNPNLGFYLGQGGMLNLQTKRGCPFQCIYCTYPAIEGDRVRGFDPARVAQQALDLQASGARYIFVTDSVFNTDVEHSLEVVAAIKRSGLKIPWGAFFSPRRTPDGYYQRLREAGCMHLEFGTDSLSEKILRRLKKPFQVKDVFAAHEGAVKAGIHVAHFLALGSPEESPATVDETLDNAERLPSAPLFFFCGLRIYPRTELYDIAVAEKQLVPGESLIAPRFYRPQEIAVEEIARRVEARAAKYRHWIVGAGGEENSKLLVRLYKKGKIGPLWELLA